MIRVERGKEVKPGVWEYRAPGYPQIFGQSRQPLLDACRQLKSMGGLTAERAGLFREGRTDPDISCPVDVGARYAVSDRASGGIRFEKYREFDSSVFQAAQAAE
jgi:hypothetical protein